MLITLCGDVMRSNGGNYQMWTIICGDVMICNEGNHLMWTTLCIAVIRCDRPWSNYLICITL